MDLLSRIVPNLPWFSVILLLMAVIEIVRVKRLLSTGRRTEGRVAELIEDSEGATPIVAFQATDGKEYRFRVQTTLGKEDWSLNTRWPVIYQETQPERAQVDRPAQRWGKAILFGVSAIPATLLYFVLKIFFVR